MCLCPREMWDSTVPDRPDLWLQEVVFGNKNDNLSMSLRPLVSPCHRQDLVQYGRLKSTDVL